jgi:hypothetical protein
VVEVKFFIGWFVALVLSILGWCISLWLHIDGLWLYFLGCCIGMFTIAIGLVIVWLFTK